MDIAAYPPIKGTKYDWYDGRYRIWTVNDIPFDRLATNEYDRPGMVTHTEWGVSYPRMRRVLSSPEVVAADDGKIELSISRIEHKPEGGCDIIKHPLDGTRYDTDRDVSRAAYEAGVIAFMVYVKDEAKYGL